MTDPGTIEDLLRSEEEELRLQALKMFALEGADSDPQLLYCALGDESWRIRKEAAELFLSSPRASELAGEIVGFLHSEDNAGLRNTAVEILVSLGRKAVPFLLSEVDCADHDVRKFICDILGEIGDPSNSAVLIAALSDCDENVRAAAAENLGKLGSVEAVSHLLAALREADQALRFVLLDALGRIGAEVPIEELLPLRHEKLLRKALFDCLGHVGSPAALPVLVEGLTDPVRSVRESAALALDRIGEHHWQEVGRVLSGTAGGEVPESLAALLQSGHAEIRRAAVKLLGAAGDSRFVVRLLPLALAPETRDVAVDALVHLARSNLFSLTSLWPVSDAGTRTCLAFVFGQAHCESAEGLLFEGLESDDPDLRSASAHALGRVGGPRCAEALARCFDDPESEVREAAQNALFSLGSRHPEATFDILRPFLQAESSEQRRLAVLALSNLGTKEVESTLALAMKDESSMVRQAAIRALGARADSRHLPSLVLALTDEDNEVRQVAVQLLGDIPQPEALQALKSALHDEDIWVRTSAVRSLGRFGGPEASRTVVEAVDDPVGLVTIAALEVLARLDRSEAQKHLERALGNRDEEVVNAALHLLVQSGRSDWIPSVCHELINHPHWDVRITFARVLVHLVGPACHTILEGRLEAEEDDLVRQHLRELLCGFGKSGG